MMMSVTMRGTNAPHRARTGAMVGFATTLAMSIVLGAFEGDEGDIASAPVWWTFILLTAGALLVTAVLLIVSKEWRRFGFGFLVGAIIALPVEAALFVLLLMLTWSD
jgi:hypothetical protein